MGNLIDKTYTPLGVVTIFVVVIIAVCTMSYVPLPWTWINFAVLIILCVWVLYGYKRWGLFTTIEPPKAEEPEKPDNRYVVVVWCGNCYSHIRLHIPKGVKFTETDQICPKCECKSLIVVRPGEGI